jgi:hypothetical protein
VVEEIGELTRLGPVDHHEHYGDEESGPTQQRYPLRRAVAFLSSRSSHWDAFVRGPPRRPTTVPPGPLSIRLSE